MHGREAQAAELANGEVIEGKDVGHESSISSIAETPFGKHDGDVKASGL